MFKMLISDKDKKTVEKLDTIQSYRMAKDMSKMKLIDAIEGLRSVKLGNLDDIKNDLIETFKSLSEK
jgi:hypothetical protein